jgi:phospholipid/cholesterol/gamma-HCH transport system ATP-binding protein
MSDESKASSEVVLKFEDVSLRFDEVQALDHVSFEMHSGATRVVLGAAGSGKTTMLKAAIGLVKPDSGKIYLLGEEVTCMTEHQLFALRSKVGVLFQEGGLFDSITVAENVAYPLENRREGKMNPSEVDTKVKDALRFVELEKTLEQFPSELSGGMRRRVGIARAVVTEPPLVLYDSPTAGLDPITATTIIALIAKERDVANTANLIVTYRYQDGELMANFRYNPDNKERLERFMPNASNGGPLRTVFMVMNEGKLVFEGSQSELEANQDKYIQKFVLKQTQN